MNVIGLARAMGELVSRFYGEWKPVSSEPLLAEIRERRMGVVSPRSIRVLITAEEQAPNSVTHHQCDVVVATGPLNASSYAAIWPEARQLDFVGFVAYVLGVRATQFGRVQDGSEGRGTVTRLPAVHAYGRVWSAIDWCMSHLTFGPPGTEATDEARGMSLLVTGAAGFGKTTLLRRLQRRASEGHLRFATFSSASDLRSSWSESSLFAKPFESILELSNESQRILWPQISPYMLLLIDDIDLANKDIFGAASDAVHRGVAIVATARAPLPLPTSCSWYTASIAPPSARDVFELLLRKSTSDKVTLSDHPSLALVSATATPQVASWLHKIVGTLSTARSKSREVEAEIGAALWTAWLGEVERKGGTSDVQAAREIAGLFSLECAVTNRDELYSAELHRLTPDAVSRLVATPEDAAGSEDLHLFLSCPFVHQVRSECVAWQSRLMKRQALVAWFVDLLTEEHAPCEVPARVALPDSVAETMLGSHLLLVCLGLRPLSCDEIEGVVVGVQEKNRAGQSLAETTLANSLDYSCKCAFFTVPPWRYLGGNCASLLARLRGNRLEGDLRGARLEAASLQGVDLSHCDLRGAYLPSVDLRGVTVKPDALACSYIHDARFDPEWLRSVPKSREVPLLGTPANQATIARMPKWDILTVSSPWTLCVPQSDESAFAPFAVGAYVTNEQYAKFVAADPGYERDQYLRRRRDRSLPLDDYYLAHWGMTGTATPVINDEPAIYVGRDAAVGYLLSQDYQPRLLTAFEWLSLPHGLRGALPAGIGEWLWGNERGSYDDSPVYRDITEYDSRHPMPALSELPIDAWLSLVIRAHDDVRDIRRVNPFNANADIGFRPILDYPLLVPDTYKS